MNRVGFISVQNWRPYNQGHLRKGLWRVHLYTWGMGEMQLDSPLPSPYYTCTIMKTETSDWIKTLGVLLPWFKTIPSFTARDLPPYGINAMSTHSLYSVHACVKHWTKKDPGNWILNTLEYLGTPHPGLLPTHCLWNLWQWQTLGWSDRKMMGWM